MISLFYYAKTLLISLFLFPSSGVRKMPVAIRPEWWVSAVCEMKLQDRSVCRIHVQKPVTSLTLQHRNWQKKLVCTLQHPISLHDLGYVYIYIYSYCVNIKHVLNTVLSVCTYSLYNQESLKLRSLQTNYVRIKGDFLHARRQMSTAYEADWLTD
jgi:hypothetical protein